MVIASNIVSVYIGLVFVKVLGGELRANIRTNIRVCGEFNTISKKVDPEDLQSG